MSGPRRRRASPFVRPAAVALALTFAQGARAAQPGYGLPVGVDDASSLETLDRARVALAGHAAESKVALLAAPSLPEGEGTSAAYVVPLSSELNAPLMLVADPPCDELAETIEVLNDAIVALADLAREAVAQAELVARLWAEYHRYVDDHAAELAVARAGTVLLIAAEKQVVQTRAAMQQAGDPDIAALYGELLVEALARVEALQNDEQYVAAWQIEAGADELMDAITHGTDAWHASYEAKLAGLSMTLDEGRQLYDEISSLEVAVGEAEFPVFDDVIGSLLAENGGVRGGVTFLAATLENVRWSFEGAAIPRSAPVFFDLATGDGDALVHRVEPLKGLEELEPAPTSLSPLSPETDFVTLTTKFGRRTDGRPVERQTLALADERPVVRVALPLGAYCGALTTTVQTVESSGAVESSAALLAHRYALTPTTPSASIVRWARADFEVLVGGAPLEVTCSVDVATLLAAAAAGDPDIERLWSHAGEWDESLFRRLEHLGIRCATPPLEASAARAMAASLRQAFELAIDDVREAAEALFGDAWPLTPTPGTAASCAPTFEGPLFASFRWSPLYWKPGSLPSQVAFEFF